MKTAILAMLALAVVVAAALVVWQLNRRRPAPPAQAGMPNADWVTFMRASDDAAMVIHVDAGAMPSAGGHLRHLVTLRLDARAWRENGFPSADDFEDVYALEDSLDKGLDAYTERYVGRQVGKQGYMLYVYAELPEHTQESLRKLTSNLASRRPRLDLREDPDWEVYRRTLYPTDDEWQRIKDEQVLARLREHDDDLTKPREVDHWLYFESRDGLDRVAEILAADGFRVVDQTPPSDEESRWTLHVTRVDSVEPDKISEVTIRLLHLAREHGGEYDGWGTSVEE